MNNITFDERLKFLRSNTLLGPISLIKLSKFKTEIEKARAMYYKLEGDLVDYDFASIEEYEYELRFETWKHKCIEYWMTNRDGLSLSDFSERSMDRQIAIERMHKRRKVRR